MNPHVVELAVERPGDDRDVGMFGGHPRDALGRGDHADERDRLRRAVALTCVTAAAPLPPVASIGSRISARRPSIGGSFA